MTVPTVRIDTYGLRNQQIVLQMICEHCGWEGSTEFARTISYGDDADVVCSSCGKTTLAEEIEVREAGNDA